MSVSCMFSKCCPSFAVPLRVFEGWESPAPRSVCGSQDRHKKRWCILCSREKSIPLCTDTDPQDDWRISSDWKISPAFSQSSSQNAVWSCPSMPGLWQLLPPALCQPHIRILHPHFWSINSPELILVLPWVLSQPNLQQSPRFWTKWSLAVDVASSSNLATTGGNRLLFIYFYLLSKRNGYQSQFICELLSVCSHSSEKFLSIPAENDFQLKQAQCMRQNQGRGTNFWWRWAVMGASPRVHPWSGTTHRVPSKGDED